MSNPLFKNELFSLFGIPVYPCEEMPEGYIAFIGRKHNGIMAEPDIQIVKVDNLKNEQRPTE